MEHLASELVWSMSSVLIYLTTSEYLSIWGKGAGIQFDAYIDHVEWWSVIFKRLFTSVNETSYSTCWLGNF